MKSLRRFAALLLLMSSAAAAQVTPPGQAAPPGATPPAIQPIPWTAADGSVQLWNGHDMTGWTIFLSGTVPVPSDFWSATGGVLHLAGKPKGYLRTEKIYSNYHLHAEWRWLGAPAAGTNNSGIFVFQHPPDAVWPNGVQVQVKAGACGDLISMPGFLFPNLQPNATIKKIADSEKPSGEWNGYDIYCRGASIEVFVNTLRQNFVDKLPTDSGQIALQVEGYPIEFRNIWLQPL
jgi:hypothetical protein